MPEKRLSHAKTLALLLAGLAFSYLLYHSLAGGTLLAHSDYDSYSLLARCWLNGTLYLPDGENYPWLELAIYEGRYYVSFPPVPALVLVPLVARLGTAAVPSNLVAAGYGLLSLAGVYALCARRGLAPVWCGFWAVLCTMGSNLYWLTTSGSVWFMAQSLNFVLCVWGLYLAAGRGTARHTAAALLLALAVGCRPFSILLLGLFFLRLASGTLWAGGKLRRPGAAFWLPFAAAAAVGLALAGYNMVRFGSPLEFGHTYLPEFQREAEGQFNLACLVPNLLQLLRPVTLDAGLDLVFPVFNGFLFFAANPVFLYGGLRLAGRVLQGQATRWDAAALAGFVLGLTALCLHRTLGGWQFGARYTVDLIPFVLAAETGHKPAAALPGGGAWFLCGCAVLFNLYGAVYMLSH